MVTHKASSTWIGDPATMPREYITLVDIIGVGGSEVPGNSPNSTVLTLGLGFSSETYTQDAMQFNPPGLFSRPIGPGTIDSTGNFTAANTSATASQGLAYVRNDQWTVFGTRDVRSQPLFNDCGPGETYLHSIGQVNEQYPAAVIQLKSNGNININTGATTVINSTTELDINGNMIKITSPLTQIGDSLAMPVTPTPYSQSLLDTVLVPFATALQAAAAGGDPLLPILFPNTAAAFTAFATAIIALQTASAPGGPTPIATSKVILT